MKTITILFSFLIISYLVIPLSYSHQIIAEFSFLIKFTVAYESGVTSLIGTIVYDVYFVCLV